MIKELFLSSGDNRLSMSKFIMFVGLVISSGILIYQTYMRHGEVNTELFIIYLCATLGTNSVNKGISVYGQLKSNSSDSNSEPASGTTAGEMYVDANDDNSGPRPREY